MTIDHTNCVQRDPNVTIEGNGIGDDAAYEKLQKELGVTFLEPPAVPAPPPPTPRTASHVDRMMLAAAIACTAPNFLRSLKDQCSLFAHADVEILRGQLTVATRELVRLTFEEVADEAAKPFASRLANALKIGHRRWLTSPNLDYRTLIAEPLLRAAGYSEPMPFVRPVYSMVLESRPGFVMIKAIELFGIAIELLALECEPFSLLAATIIEETKSLFPSKSPEVLCAIAGNLIQ